MSLEIRRNILIGVTLSIALVLILRLIQLQLLGQEEYGMESRRNSIKTVTIVPARGLMYDRNGVIVVDNKPAYLVSITPSQFDTLQKGEIASLLEIDQQVIDSLLKSAKGTHRFNPVLIKRDVDFKVISYIAENQDRLNGVDFQVEAIRLYPNDFRASHIFGYTKEISPKMLEEQVGDYYKQGDLVGKKGLEKTYEEYLRGEKGYELISVDVKGREMGAYNDGKDDIEPVNGSDLILSLDGELQSYAEKLMAGKRGAIIAVDPRNGEVLCMVSKPDFDLSLFAGSTSAVELNAIVNDPAKPLFNRVTLTTYPPGSTWKMMMGLAGLASGKITTKSTIFCGGSFSLGSYTWQDHGSYGSIPLPKALEVSSNVFFYKLGYNLGIDDFHKYCTMLGFGQKTGIDISEEGQGRLPSREYYNKIFGDGKWPGGVMVNLGIGQGELGVTPVQMVAYTAAIAMNGLYCQPHFVAKIINSNTGEVTIPEFYKRDIDFPDEYWEVVKKGMYLVVNGASGTARGIKNEDYILAGKTGTAQTQGNNHSWFVGFAPFDDPKIAICVLGENAGWGSQFGAPVAAAIMIRYLSNNSVDMFNQNESKITPVIQD
ncbi:penicillin-binding protein 2 [Ignavibacteria bacterium CHB1]|nr:MAG: penicillin-binding protein 2 [Chlorobiota bacterium]MBV6399373.1 Peptidoglycan D,D-transpeptidase MrdA [Ignavibacteria bacterium]MCC6886874.1 penicillin-binding protein 2 [Ignavibacteriales bacterium]MCE7953929.1 penicillin-binding protein 2 [Chlorobi bacterium CHB7]MDL1887862.1 penicillin-binding protein 2 [Ignavibacteria bacterium CHB1]RIK47948.1 MAG: penicillin-binding protein 2 [Ignavibacteriota bacterium]